MEHVEAEAAGRDLSLIVENANEAARSLYRGGGFVTEATRPIVGGGWGSSGDEYCLMLRRSAPQAQNRACHRSEAGLYGANKSTGGTAGVGGEIPNTPPVGQKPFSR